MRVMKLTGVVCAGVAVVLYATLVGTSSAQDPVAQEPEQPQVPNAPSAPIAPVKGGTITGMTGQVANDTVKGAALMDEARKALGGVAKLAAIQRLEFKGVTRRAQGDQAVEGDFTIQLEPFEKYKRVEEIAIGGNAGLIVERTEALNGAEAWEDSGGGFPGRGGFGGGGFPGGGGDFRGGGGGGFRGGGDRGGRGGALGELIGAARGGQDQAGIDPERLKQLQLAQRQQEVARLVLATVLATKGTVAWIGTGQAPEGLADVVEITQPNHPPVRMLLHQATHMPLMMMWEGPAARGGGGLGRRGGGRGARGGDAPPAAAPAAPAGPPAAGRSATIEMYLSGYKAVNGVQLPHVISRGSNGTVQEELEVKGYKVNPNFKSNTFAQEK